MEAFFSAAPAGQQEQLAAQAAGFMALTLAAALNILQPALPQHRLAHPAFPVVTILEAALDSAARVVPNPGDPAHFPRVTGALKDPAIY